MQSQRFKELRDYEDDVKRGYIFEQYVRETLPWTFRPPIPVSTRSEQLDAFFEFNGWHFLVEAKAKRGVITPGSHDWEDFELKVRRRGGRCIGLFCSLWPISEAIHAAADELNRSHHTTIIIEGAQWDDLDSADLSHDLFLRYLVGEARARNRTSVPPVAEIQRTLFDAWTVEEEIRTLLGDASATFLRRHRTLFHKSTYIERALDSDVASLVHQLRPSRLARTKKVSRRGPIDVEQDRAAPPQVAVVRDLSGAGKTTLSVQLAEDDRHLAVCRAALQPDMDKLGEILGGLGEKFGLAKLILVDKPLLYVVDSLDEATSHIQKRTELRGLLALLESFNENAREKGLQCFPLLILLTVRDEYWRDWESQLEGHPKRSFTRRFSRFNQRELPRALERYQSAYGYQIDQPVNSDLYEALSHPFTLQVYSEANRGRGEIDASSHLGSHVLSLFFERKKEDLDKRPVPGLDGDGMLTICREIAVEMILARRDEIDDDSVEKLVQRIDPLVASKTPALLRSLRSEQIFEADGAERRCLRFRHGRFLEFLIAKRVFEDLRTGRIRRKTSRQPFGRGRTSSSRDFDRERLRPLGANITEVYEIIAATAFASPFVVVDYLRALAVNDPVMESEVQSAFAGSEKFMGSFLLQKRSELALGGGLTDEEARAIQMCMTDRNPALNWDGYFVLAAAGSGQGREIVRNAFVVAWETNQGLADLYKSIPKLKRLDLLTDEEVVRRVVKSRDSKCWLSFLDQMSARAHEFPDLWRELGGDDLEIGLKTESGADWGRVLWVLSFLKKGLPFPLGNEEVANSGGNPDDSTA